MTDSLRILFVVFALALPGLAQAESDLVTFPAEIDPTCRGGRAKIYDECGDQHALFLEALAEANRQDKVLLVSYGAEWCIWCHVFDAYVHGVTDEFTHTFSTPEDEVRNTATIYERADRDVSAEAEALKTYVAENFILLHLEARHSEGSREALMYAGINPYESRGLPFIFTAKQDGLIAKALDETLVETRRDDAGDWFRGYNRVKLLSVLRVMHDAAR